MANIVAFDSAPKLPAKGGRAFAVTTDLVSGGPGYPTMSIKGKVFHIKRGDEKIMVTKPEAPDEPAASLEVVIVGAYPPGQKHAKVYYATGYTEGADAKPTCSSNDGEHPDTSSEEVQAKTCQACPHNVFGSKITEDGRKAKACADSKRLAVAAVDNLNDPMLLRVPAASLKALSEFNKLVASRGYPYQELVTKIGFDYTVAHPALTFKPVGVLDDATVQEVLAASKLEVTQQILGILPTEAEDDVPFVPAAKPAAAEKPKAKPAAKAAPVVAADDGDDLPTQKRAEVKVEQPVAAKPAPKPAAAAPEVVDAEEGLESALGDLDFDD
jgi:hypothetical protein